MIIVGDIASPTEKHSLLLNKVFQENAEVFKAKTVICNFEGLIDNDIKLSDNNPVLFNHRSVLEVFKANQVKAVGLANNHILDLPSDFKNTLDCLNEYDIVFSGAAVNREDASIPAHFMESGTDVYLFNACWDFLLYHQKNPTKGVYIAEINEQRIIESVYQQRVKYPVSALIVYLHWSFDLETLPFPMYRQFAKKLIDIGANLVIGSHSHCVQGGEKHKDGYIVYGLGNFFLPYNTFANSYLTFPDFARIQLAFEWDIKRNTAKCHWFEYLNEADNHLIKHLASEVFEESATLRKYSPFAFMSDSEYLEYFKKNRRKKFLVPVYVDYTKTMTNRVYTFFLKSRGKFARLLAKHKFRKWQN